MHDQMDMCVYFETETGKCRAQKINGTGTSQPGD